MYLKQNRLFWQQLLNYILLVVILLTGIIILFVSIRDRYEKAVEANSLNSVDHMVDGLDTRFDEVNAVASQIVTNDTFNNYAFLQATEDKTAYSFLMDTFKGIPSYPEVNDILYDSVAYFYDSRSFLSPLRVSKRAENFYDSFMKYEGLSYSEWVERIKAGPIRDHYWSEMRMRTSNVSDQDIITFLKYFHNTVNPKGVISILIEKDKLFEQVDLTPLGVDGSLYVIEPYEETIITAYQPKDIFEETIKEESSIEDGINEVVIDGENYYMVRHESDAQPLSYIAFISTGAMMKDVKDSTQKSLIVFVLLLVVAVGLSTYFTYVNIKPVREIIRILDRKEAKLIKNNSGEYAFIKGGISDLIERNTDLHDDLEREALVLRSIFISRLLLKDYSDEAMIHGYLQESKINLIDDNYVLLTGKIYGVNSVRETLSVIDEKRIAVSRELRERLGLNIYMQNMEVDKIVGIIAYPKTVYYEEIQIKLEKITIELLDKYEIPMMFAMSHQYNELIDTPMHYNSNSGLLSNYFPKRLNIIYSNDINEENEVNYYTRAVQDKLISLIKMGEGAKAYEGIVDLLSSYHDIPSKKLKLILSQVKNTLEKIEINTNKEFNMKAYYLAVSKLSEAVTVKQYIEYLQVVIMTIADHFMITKESSNTVLRDRIIDFVSENLDNPDLCLAMIAGALDVSEKYVSRYFKDQTGQNLIAYIEELRMEKATGLITGSVIPLKEVSIAVGYLNNNTFYKAFKRKYGMSPGDYRRTSQSNKS